jgi:hypothetical protein
MYNADLPPDFQVAVPHEHLTIFFEPRPRGLRNLTLSTVLADELEPTALKVLWVTCVARCACLPRPGGNITISAFGMRDRDEQRF